MKEPDKLESDETTRHQEVNMSCYQHLTIEERESLMLLWEKGCSIRQIARELHRSPSTISRELRRNNPKRYRASEAEKRYRQKRKRCVRKRILGNTGLLKMIAFLLGSLVWSPTQIAKRMEEECGAHILSANTIYRALDNGPLRKTLRYYLRIKYKKLGKNSKRNKKCFANSITNRPQAADLRLEDGHWEGDTIHSSREREALVTLVDRRTRFLLCCKVPNLESSTVTEAIVKLLRESGLPVRSLTLDQGTEFVEGEKIAQQLGIGVYFAHPHSPWERPTNENTNGLLRQFFPKRSRFSLITDDEVQRYTALLNFRPRACLGWLTPYEVAFHQVLHLT